MGRTGKRNMAAILIGTLLLGGIPIAATSTVYATEATRKKLQEAENEKKETEENLDETKEELNNLNEQKNSLQGQLHTLNEQLRLQRLLVPGNSLVDQCLKFVVC